MSDTGQTADGWWEIGVRRTAALPPEKAWQLIRTLVETDDVRVRSETPGTVLRATYQPAGWAAPSTVQLRVLPAATGSTLAVHHEHLPDEQTREAMRVRWTTALEQLLL